MRPLALTLTTFLAAAALAPASSAGVPVRVTVTGEVEYNQIGSPPLSNVQVGQAANLSFLLDSAVFLNSVSFPTRGYAIDTSSFALQFPGGSVGLQNPFPAGQTPYFVIRNNDPGVDGFYVSTNVDSPIGVPLTPSGSFGKFRSNFSVTYGASALPSLDLLDALGSYDYDGLSVFHWTVDDGPFEPLGLIFETITIAREDGWDDLGGGTLGINGQPMLAGYGTLVAGADTTLQLTDAAPSALMVAWLSFSSTPLSALGGTVHAFPFNSQFVRVSDAAGAYGVSFPWPAAVPSGIDLYLQFLVQDLSVIYGITLSNAVMTTTP